MAAAVEKRLAEHNRKKQRRKERVRYGTRARSRRGSLVDHPIRLPTLAASHPAMEHVQGFNAEIRSAFGRLVFWANANAPGLLEAYPSSLLALAKHRINWVRPVEHATPKGKSSRTRLLHLTRFLLEEYPAPRPLLHAIFRPEAEPIAWFSKAARGESLRKVVNLAGFTKKAAHFLWSAPEDLGLMRSVRWAQVRALGGDAQLARTVATQGYLSDHWAREAAAFWHHVLAWLVAHPSFPRERIGELTFFIAQERHRVADFSMKGRSVERLVALLDERNQEAAKEAKRTLVRFASCGLSPGVYVVPGPTAGFERTWRIEEILDSEALYREGMAMRHCVASYDDDILRKESAIFSMTREHLGERKRALTVEVIFNEGKRSFGEVRGKANRDPTPEELAIVKRWGQRECVRFEN